MSHSLLGLTLEVGPRRRGHLHLLEPGSDSGPQIRPCWSRLPLATPGGRPLLDNPGLCLSTHALPNRVFIYGRSVISIGSKFDSVLSFSLHS